MLGEIVEERYLIEAELGVGAMGRVYRARHLKVGRSVAIKVMHEELGKVPESSERFAREAMVAARLSRLSHPNVVSVLDVGTTRDGLPLIVLELAPGEKLSHLMDGALSRERVMNLIGQLLSGLDHAHTEGLIHRDLKPDNILVEVTSDGTEIARIIDFGIAVTRERDDSTVAGRRLTEVNTVLGTPFYMSPEQARAKDLDHRSDLFSLGVIMYELLAGMPPFPGTGVEVVLANACKNPPAIRDRAGIEVDPLLEAFARKLMARRREDRFQSAAEALVVLAQIEHDRIAAARALSITGQDVTAPLRVGDRRLRSHDASRLTNNSDLVCSQPIVPPTRVIRPTRIRRRNALAAAAAALAILTVITGWSATQVESSAPSNQLTTADSKPSVREPSAPEHVETPALEVDDIAAPAETVTAAAANATKPTSVKATQARTATTLLPPLEVQGAGATSANVKSVRNTTTAGRGDSAAALAARYVAVGKALRGASNELWERYRRIRINEAIATKASRRAALVALAQIERAIR